MRGKSSSKQGSRGFMEIDKLDEPKEEPHLSGAYIRSLVKHLTSTRAKDPINFKDQDNFEGVDGISAHLNSTENGEKLQQSQPPPPQQQPSQHKKQVRRRLHTSRPYQERLLNMAEARREIVTALKFHRAAMRQQQQNQQQQEEKELQPSLQNLPQVPLEQEGKSKSRRNPRIYASDMTCVNNLPQSGGYVCSPNNPYYYWPSTPPVAPPITFPENLNFALPNQPLGLNLNLQDFNNDLESSFYHSLSNPTNFSSASSPSTSSSPPHLSVATTEEVFNVAMPQEGLRPMVAANNNAESGMTNCGETTDFHQAMDDKEMAEIRSIGEQHQMEWNDTLNFVTSAWWFKFLKNMEVDESEEKAEEFGNFPFDEVIEFPSWLNSANESCLDQHLSDYCFHDYMQDPALPCMEIEEIEGMDVEWLS